MSNQKNISPTAFEDTEIGKIYFDILDWLEANGKPKTHNVAIWAAWVAMPQSQFRKKAGLPTTAKALAEHLGINVKTLERYKKSKPELVKFAKQKVASSLFASALPKVIQATINSAVIEGRDGLGDRKIIYQMSGLLPSGSGNTAVAVAGAGANSKSESSVSKTENSVEIYLPDNNRNVIEAE